VAVLLAAAEELRGDRAQGVIARVRRSDADTGQGEALHLVAGSIVDVVGDLQEPALEAVGEELG